MDDELRALMERFQSVQKMGTKNVLNERNCVEIVQKLMQKKIVDLVYTTDGREYVTKKHLEKEIRDEIDMRCGRVTAAELPNILNVSQLHIDNALQQLVTSHQYDGLYRLTPSGEIITEAYLYGITEQIAHLLKSSGRLSLLDLARRFNLEFSLLSEYITAQLSSKKTPLLKVILEENYLYTEAFIVRQFRILRGSFLAITVPTNIPSLIASLSKEPSVQTVLYGELQKLLDSGILKGTVKGGLKGTYTPAVYENHHIKMIETSYMNEGHLSYSLLRKLCISSPAQWLDEKFRNGSCFPTFYISTHLLEENLEGVAEALSRGGLLLDLSLYLPTESTDRDYNAFTALLVDRIPSFDTNYRVVDSSWVLHVTFIKALQQKLEKHAYEEVTKYMKGWKPDPKNTTATKRKKRCTSGPTGPKSEDILSETAMVEIVKSSLVAHESGVLDSLEDIVLRSLSAAIYSLLSDSVAFAAKRFISQKTDDLDHGCAKQEQTHDQQIQTLWQHCNLVHSSPADMYPKSLPKETVLSQLQFSLLAAISKMVLVQNGYDTVSTLKMVINSPDQLLKLLDDLPPGHSDPIKRLLGQMLKPDFLKTCEQERGQLGVFLKIPKTKELREMRKACSLSQLSLKAETNAELLQVAVGVAYTLYFKVYVPQVPSNLLTEVMGKIDACEDRDDLAVQMLYSAYEQLQNNEDDKLVEQSLAEVTARLRELVVGK
eukprot:TRINITY_DN12168_c0_g1_i1.p1 TRINITY_DN12168_c0_g1~~TRINITY_DN12168_c0_g1_i1.p1  ORF type:complete len:715 (+),score=115.62 TRINITY_DN12168_c0_g1_i1:85-2229(+)